MKEVKLEAERRHVELVIVPTSEAIRLIEKESAVNATLHVTCQETHVLGALFGSCERFTDDKVEERHGG
jgi:hypothetical protein